MHASIGALRHASQSHIRWSAPSTLAGCSGAQAPAVVFPQETPFRRTGAGAIVYAGAPSCPRRASLELAAIDPHDLAGRPHPPLDSSGRAIALGAPFAAAATTRGQIALIGAEPGGGPGIGKDTGTGTRPQSSRRSGNIERPPAHSKGAGAAAAISEGPADGPFTTSTALPGPVAPLGLATAYLGDVAVASQQPTPQEGLQIRMQRHFQAGFPAPVALGGAGGRQRALAVALDYRTDAMAVWWRDGWLYARERHANGPLGPLQRFAKAGPRVQLSLLISDDGRAIVAWVDPQAHSARLYLDVSAPGMQLGPGVLLERLRWPSGPPPPDGSVRLVRLSTESVLMAWTGTREGRFVVRAAGIDLLGVRTTSDVSVPGEDAVLDDLATGPLGDAVAVWSQRAPTRRGPGGAQTAIMAARGVPSSRGVARFGPPERVAATARPGGVAVAIDPASDAAVASWREASGAIRYAVR